MSVHEPHHGHADCSEVLLRIYEYLDGELTPADVRRIAEHLQACQPCLAQHDVDVAVKGLVARTWAPEPAPVQVRMHVVQRLTLMRRDLEL